MSEDELRGVFNENYNDKVVAGSDRYYEPESADKRDALRAARSSGASGKGDPQGSMKSTVWHSWRRAPGQIGCRSGSRGMSVAMPPQRERDMLLFGQRKELQVSASRRRRAAPATATAADKPLRFDDAQRPSLPAGSGRHE